MTRIPELTEQITAAAALLLAEVDRVAMRGAGADAADWARAVAAVERAGRVVDAVRIAVTAPAVSAGREVPAVVQALGARSGVDAVAQLAGVSEPEARRRLTVAATTTNEVALSGAVVPPRMCQLAQAMREGRLGVEAAAVIVRELDRVRHRVPAEDVQAAEEGLVVLAAGRDGSCSPIPVEFVNDAAKTWVAAIDPDGTRPREQRMMRRRSLRFGVEDADGLIPISGRIALVPGLQLTALIEAHRRSGTDVSFDDADPAGPRDERTLDQQRHDALVAVITAAARAVDAPTLGGVAPSVLVTVTVEDLEDPEGRRGDAVGRLDGSSTPVSRDEVERLIDTTGMQTVTMTAAGAVMGMCSAQRCFTAAQRRAIAARDGGCVIPGCRVPASGCQVHHVVPWRDGGPTSTSNGALLCWWHHFGIDTGPWRIRMIDGVPHIRGPGHPEWEPAVRAGPVLAGR